MIFLIFLGDILSELTLTLIQLYKISAHADGVPRSPSAHIWRGSRPPIDTSGFFGCTCLQLLKPKNHPSEGGPKICSPKMLVFVN